MLRLSRFKYLQPNSVHDALALLQNHGQNAMLVAGGTDLLVNIKHRLFTPDFLISLRNIPELTRWKIDRDGWLHLGAGVTLSAIEHTPHVSDRFPALAEAAHLVSAPQIRTIATIGGNVCLDTRCNYYNQSHEWRRAIGYCMKKDSPICRVAPGGDRCWAVASADTVPVLIALRAEVTVIGPRGERRLDLYSLYQDDGLVPLKLAFGEIVTAIHIPPPQGYVTVYQKFRLRQSFDFPLVGVAVSLRQSSTGATEDARVVTTALASQPQRTTPVESSLIGQVLAAPAIEGAGQAMFRLAKPMDNTAGTIFHRKRMARVLLERALWRVADEEPSLRR